ncbi:hypothetical protein LXL04_002998 [Taraxacum kok-saghyz]
MAFEIGTSVEVMQTGEGLEGSYFAGVVIDRTPGMRKIRYKTLLDDQGKPLEELISMRRLRPPPPRVDERMSIGDLVDAFDNDGWWVGRYIRREGDNYITRPTVPPRVVSGQRPEGTNRKLLVND